jgi:hypothetical protein
MLLQVPHVLNVDTTAQPSRGVGLLFDLDGDGMQLKALGLTGFRYRPLCPWSKP